MLKEFLVVSAIVVVTGLGLLFSVLSFIRLPEASGVFVRNRH